MKAVVATFNQEKALVGAFSVITNLRMELFQALVRSALACVLCPRVLAAVIVRVILLSTQLMAATITTTQQQQQRKYNTIHT